MSRFFINRPIFAGVISILIVLAGLIASRMLPIAMFPEVAPPVVTITANYPGASAETLAKTVAAPIEQQLNGIDHMLYFNSSASSSGTLTITVTFDVGSNLDMDTMYVNNRVSMALPALPDDVRRTGVTVQKKSNDILMVIGMRSSDPRYDTLYLSNYTSVNVLDDLKRVPGVADAMIFGAQDYSMRIWLKPDRMAQLGVTATDIAQAIQSQNAQYAIGKIGQQPAPKDQQLVYSVSAHGRLLKPEEFGNIIIRASGPNGVLRVKDVARVELGAQSYDMQTQLDGKPNISIGIFLQSGANALAVEKNVRQAMDALSTRFPQGINYVIPFNTNDFVNASIHDVTETILEAALLVVLVVFIFLQNWRATLVPVIAVPVSIIGTFGGLYAMGFSINTFTLFALVLSIGIVVDDAIVVLENVERLMSTQHLSPYEAAIEAMREVSSAIIAIVLVLCSVFVPIAFLGGIAGKLYQQFAVTVSISVIISGIVALTLTPALCALLLKNTHQENRLFRPFNRLFDRITRTYTDSVRFMLKRSALGIILFAALTGVTVLLFSKVPGSFVPQEDMGYIIGSVVLPDGANLTRTSKLTGEVQSFLNKNPAVNHVLVLNGMDFIGGGNKYNAATMFVTLKPWDERKMSASDIIKSIFMKGASLRDGLVLAFNPPPIRGIGSAGGFEFYVQNRADGNVKSLAPVVQKFVDALKKRPELASVNTFFRPSVPQLSVEVDQEKALSLGVPINDIYTALQSMMGSYYVNDFNKSGKTYRVLLQAEPQYRAQPEDLGAVYVRSTTGTMIPLKALITVKSVTGPEQVERFNGFTATKIMGSGAPGISSSQAIKVVEDVARATLPQGYDIAWSGQAFLEKTAGKTAGLAFLCAIIMVFLILAAKYERWSLPVAVLMAVPFGLFGAMVSVLARHYTNDIYFQVGLVTLIGLAAKNAILIVEFAAQKRAEGMGLFEAAVEAARLRFRPIVMTSLAFVLGVLPLAIASGAGAASRRSMGTGVDGGMLAATFIAPIFIPLFFVLLSRWHERKLATRAAQPVGLPVDAEEQPAGFAGVANKDD
jgi:multidrug efflux pump